MSAALVLILIGYIWIIKLDVFSLIEEAGIVMDDIEEDSDTDTDFESDITTNSDIDLERYSITELEQLLKEAIEVEDYAKASVLRDIINDKKQIDK